MAMNFERTYIHVARDNTYTTMNKQYSTLRKVNELIIKMITYNNNDLRLNFLMRH